MHNKRLDISSFPSEPFFGKNKVRLHVASIRLSFTNGCEARTKNHKPDWTKTYDDRIRNTEENIMVPCTSKQKYSCHQTATMALRTYNYNRRESRDWVKTLKTRLCGMSRKINIDVVVEDLRDRRVDDSVTKVDETLKEISCKCNPETMNSII